MNNNITEDYVSFEVAKLLKEKGFDIRQAFCFTKDGKRKPEIWVNQNDNVGWECTHALAIKWIRENFNWNIETGYRNSHKDYSSTIYPMFPNTQVHRTERFKTSEDSVEAALLYTLKNLIP